MGSPGRRTADALSAAAPTASAPQPPIPAAVPWPPGSVAARMFAESYAFDFFQAVRLLQMLEPGRAPVGGTALPATEVVRFRTLVSLNFPSCTIYDLEKGASPDQPHAMTVTFMGLMGANGVLPRHYTELLLRIRRDSKNPEKNVLRDWFDLYNHRLLSLFFQAWAKYRFWVAYERGEANRLQPDPFTACLYSLIGLGLPALRNRLHLGVMEEADGKRRERILTRVDDRVLLYYSGLLAHRPRCAVGLAGMLEDYLGLPVEVCQFHGQWLVLGRDNESRLGTPNGNSELGVNLVVGERVWDVQSMIRIRVGPLTAVQFQEFMPDRTPMPERKVFFHLVHLVRLYIGPELDFDVQLILKAEEVGECQLPEQTGDGPQLGWNSWITSQALPADADDAVFDGVLVVRINA